MLNMIFYLGCVLLLLKGVELFIGAMRDAPGSMIRILGFLGAALGIGGGILLSVAGERIANIERADDLPPAVQEG